MPITTPTATTKTLALECVRRVVHDYLTTPDFPAGMGSGEVDVTRYRAVAKWAEMGKEIARDEWSDGRMWEFVQSSQREFICCEDITAIP